MDDAGDGYGRRNCTPRPINKPASKERNGLVSLPKHFKRFLENIVRAKSYVASSTEKKLIVPIIKTFLLAYFAVGIGFLGFRNGSVDWCIQSFGHDDGIRPPQRRISCRNERFGWLYIPTETVGCIN